MEPILFRCSALGSIMADGDKLTEKQEEFILEMQSKPKRTDKQTAEMNRLIQKKTNPDISEGTKSFLADMYVMHEYGRKEDITSKYFEKGHKREEDSITLLSRLTGIVFKKNDIRLSNDFIKGECDIFTGESITNADKTYDTKTAWSCNTFFRNKLKGLSKDNYWQGMGYMFLTGAKEHTVAHCLVNGTPKQIMDEKRKASWKYDSIDVDTNPDYIKECKRIEKNHIFDMPEFFEENPGFDFASNLEEWKWDIPMEKRMYTHTIQRNEEDIMKIISKTLFCREWIKSNFK